MPIDERKIGLGFPQTEVYRLGANGPSLKSVIAAADGRHQQLSLLCLDVDGVGAIHAAMGENVVEQALVAISRRVLQTIPENARFWRLGGEGFVVALVHGDEQHAGEALVEQLRDAFDTPLQGASFTLDISLSIGLARYPEHAHDAQTLLEAAEQALRKAKRGGPGSFASYTPELTAQTTDAVPKETLEHRFVDAIAHSEFRLYYQPVVSGQDGSIVACSALLRWHDTQEGVLRANRVLPAIERAGLAGPVGLWTIETAMRQVQRWRSAGIDYVTASVPLESALLLRFECVDIIADLLHRTGLPGSALEYEISESALALDDPHVMGNLEGLRAQGSILTLADFGTRGLGLNALAQYPLERFKIDHSFLRNITNNPRRAALLRGMIAMGHKLGMTVIAKGVETEAELGFLRRQHCDFFQGYLFSPPLPDAGIDALVRSRFLRPDIFQDTTDFAASRTLLLLDDEDNILRSLVRLLRRDGYRILTANSVSEAFDLLACNDVQVIMSDQRMPEMSGIEFLSRVRDLYPNTVRLALSGYADMDVISQAISQGAVFRFLLKPWDDADLREHVREAFRLVEQQRSRS